MRRGLISPDHIHATYTLLAGPTSCYATIATTYMQPGIILYRPNYQQLHGEHYYNSIVQVMDACNFGTRLSNFGHYNIDTISYNSTQKFLNSYIAKTLQVFP